MIGGGLLVLRACVLVSACGIAVVSAATADPALGRVRIVATFPADGPIVVALVTASQYRSDDLPAAHRIHEPTAAEQRQKRAVIEFSGVEFGTYAVVAYQDRNRNGELDSGWFGPTEPWGMSYRERPAFRAPSFQEIQFTLDADAAVVVVEIALR